MIAYTMLGFLMFQVQGFARFAGCSLSITHIGCIVVPFWAYLIGSFTERNYNGA